MRSKRSHRKGSPDNAQNVASPPQQQSFNAHTIISPPQTTPEQARGVFALGINGALPTNSSILAAAPNAETGQPLGTHVPSSQPISFAPVNQPHPSTGSMSEERPAQQESGGLEYSRDRINGGVAGEAMSVGPEVNVDTNGERRVPPDTEMSEARPEGQSSGAGGGFTAVNR